jgi:hypothetical protein
MNPSMPSAASGPHLLGGRDIRALPAHPRPRLSAARGLTSVGCRALGSRVRTAPALVLMAAVTIDALARKGRTTGR